jgi:hypothetical protein
MPRRGCRSTCREIDLRSYPDDARASSGLFAATCGARLKTSALIRHHENALTEDARSRLRRSAASAAKGIAAADFRLRLALGMVAGIRHAACHQRRLDFADLKVRRLRKNAPPRDWIAGSDFNTSASASDDQGISTYAAFSKSACCMISSYLTVSESPLRVPVASSHEVPTLRP